MNQNPDLPEGVRIENGMLVFDKAMTLTKDDVGNLLIELHLAEKAARTNTDTDPDGGSGD